MAGIEALPYDYLADEYICPNGRRLSGEEVRRLDALADSLAGEGNSLLINRNQSLTRKIDTNLERIEFMSTRLDRQRELLLIQFYNMESVIAGLQDSLSVIEGIAGIPPLVSTNS